jgi:hypothetical protein
MYGKGPDSECGSLFGGNYTNMVFKRPQNIVGEWEYKGCFKETDDRAIFIELGFSPNLEKCKEHAAALRYNVIGFSKFGCYAGNYSNYAVYGALNDCPKDGGAYMSQVYVRPYKYKGCFKDFNS